MSNQFMMFECGDPEGKFNSAVNSFDQSVFCDYNARLCSSIAQSVERRTVNP